jgi:hypothetical protein
VALHLALSKEEYEEVSNYDILHRGREHWHKDPPQEVKQAIAKQLKKTGDNSTGFAPSNLQARQVGSLLGLGMTTKEVADCLIIDEKLLRFYYKHEIETAVALVNAKVGHVALKMALKGDSPSSTQFWLKTRAGWKETQVVESKVEITEVTSAREKLLGPRPPIDGECVEVQELTPLPQDIFQNSLENADTTFENVLPTQTN